MVGWMASGKRRDDGLIPGGKSTAWADLLLFCLPTAAWKNGPKTKPGPSSQATEQPRKPSSWFAGLQKAP